MKNQQSTARRIQNTIMKSPSPDIANRNIIKDTKTPIDDIKRYLERSAQSKSPRLSQLNKSAQFKDNSTNQIQMLKLRIKELQFKNMSLTNQNQQFKRALAQKYNTHGGDLHKMRDTLRSYDSSQVVTPKSQDKSNLAFAQMQDRVIKLINQNTRLGNLLQQKQNYLKGIQMQIQKIKGQTEYYKSLSGKNIQYPNTSSAATTNSMQPQQLNTIRNYYQGKLEPEMRRSQTQWLNRLRQLSDRMNKIQSNQNYIQKQINKRNSIITPIKNNAKSPISNKPTDDHNQYSSSGIQLPQSVKPFESMTMRSTIKDQSQYSRQYDDHMRQLQNRNKALERQIQLNRRRIFDLQEQLRRTRQSTLAQTLPSQQQNVDQNKNKALERQNQGNRRRISDLQQQLKRAREIPNVQPLTTQQSVEFIKKIRELQQANDSKAMTINNLDRDLRSAREDLSRLKDKADRESFLVQNERSTCKKALQQQKQKNSELQEKVYKLNQRINGLQNKLKQKQLGSQQIRQQLRSQFDYKESNIKKYYEQLLKNKDKIIGQKLHEYLMMLTSIRKDIQDSNYEQIVTECQYAINDRNTIQKQIMFIKEQNQKIIMQMKTRLIEQEQRIIQLEKDNQMLRAQIRQLQYQKQKLKKAMLQFDSIKPMTTSNMNMTASYTTSFKSEQGCKLKACLKQTLKKIDILQHQITEILQE